VVAGVAYVVNGTTEARFLASQGVLMKIAVATKNNWSMVSGHAGQTTDWLLYDCQPGEPRHPAKRIQLTKEQLPHHFKDDGPHPLHGVAVLVAASAGDGYIRHMEKWGAQVILTGETDPHTALNRVVAGEALADTRFDITTTLCKLRDLFSRH
jgi:putative NIF3 family GTP cyclohydrolase 1 type 2